MKRIIIIGSVLAFFAATFLVIERKQYNDSLARNINSIDTETRAIYISYIEFNSYIKDKDEFTSKENIVKMLDNIKGMGFNTVIVHVRPFSDSIYESKYYPLSNTILNNNGSKPNYDVLEYFIDESHKRELKLEAWINPYRISNDTDVSQIPIDSVYYKFIESKGAKVIENKGIYLNPASKEVSNLIINGVIEIVEKYDVDGIHFDDYFYPDKTIDMESYEEYKKNEGSLSIGDYRMSIISDLIKSVYLAIKKIDENVVFGIAPEGNIENNYENHFINIEQILSEKGYIDYIMPQIYFGFQNENKPFIGTINMWNNLIKNDSIKLIPALAFYKCGKVDNYAGSGSREWIENSDIIKKQILISRNESNYGGFSLFRYDYIFNKNKYSNTTEDEIDGIKEVILKRKN